MKALRDHALPGDHRRLLLLLCAVTLPSVACAQTIPPRQAEVLVYVDTDAPLALSEGETLTSTTPTPLFDRLRIEILDPSGNPACSECTEDFSVDEGALASGNLSFGVLPKAGQTALLARARLFRGARARGDIPAAGATIDTIVTLPVPNDGELKEVTIMLPLEAVGVPADLTAPIAPLVGKMVAGKVHPKTVPSGCTSTAKDNQVCVWGGAYWMSDPLLGIEPSGQDPAERVAIMSPYWLDAGEATVSELRASGLASSGVVASAGDPTGCTYTAAPSKNDALPVTCISWATADAFCKARGSRLPTEAEIEFAAGGRRMQRAVWGSDAPMCSDTVMARADATKLDPVEISDAECATATALGPAPRGTGHRDVLTMPSGQIFDLMGNVLEWVSDDDAPIPSPCWTFGTVFDPVCTTKVKSTDRVARGADWSLSLPLMTSTSRYMTQPAAGTPRIGVRCARDGS